jgi:hypothetical protein
MEKILELIKSHETKVPVWAGWIILAATWPIFISTSNHILEFILGLACCYAFYLGFRKKKYNLMTTSIANAIWMFTWSFGSFDDLLKLINPF